MDKEIYDQLLKAKLKHAHTLERYTADPTPNNRVELTRSRAALNQAARKAADAS